MASQANNNTVNASEACPKFHVERLADDRTFAGRYFLARARTDTAPYQRPGYNVEAANGTLVERNAKYMEDHPLLDIWNAPRPGQEKTLFWALADIVKDDNVTFMSSAVGGASTGGHYGAIMFGVHPLSMKVDRAVEIVTEAAKLVYQYEELRDLSVEVSEFLMAGAPPVHLKFKMTMTPKAKATAPTPEQ